MAKVLGPALSISASKSLKKTVTFQRRPSGHAIYPHTKPGDREPFTPSTKQNNQRQIIGNLVEQWKILSQNQKDAWDREASQIGYIGTGYHYFIHTKGAHSIIYEWSDSKITWSDPNVSWSGY